MSQPDYFEEIRALYEKFRKLESSTIRLILDRWSDRRPLELTIDLMQDVLTNFSRLKETSDAVIRYLKDRDWRGAIVSIVGEYGSGKTQFGQILLRRIEEEGIFSRIITISPLRDMKEVMLEALEASPAEGPAVLIIDEVDQLLGELNKGSRRMIEDLADTIRGVTEGGHGYPPMGSVVMLLSKRAREALRSDRALGSRLMDRSKELSLSMSEDEREKASKEALNKIIALWMAYYDDEMRYAIRSSLDRIYPFMRRVASELSRTREIGGIVKGLTELSSRIIENLGRSEQMGRIEEGNFAESLLRRFLSSEMRSIQLNVRMGDITRDYIAIFSDEPLSAPGARTDAHFDVWTYDASKGVKGGVLTTKVGVEIKYGRYWMERKDQLSKIMNAYPLLLISIAEMDPDEITDVKVEMGRRFDIVDINPDMFRMIQVLRDDAVMRFLRDWTTLDRDLKEALEELMRGSVKVKEEASEQDILMEASASLLSSVFRELKKAKTSKRYDTLSKLIARSIESVFSKYGERPPSIQDTVIYRIVRILEREGIGRMSQSGKSFSVDKDCRLKIEEIESDLERRRRIERIIFDVLSRPAGVQALEL